MLFSVHFKLAEIWDQITNKTFPQSTLSDVCMCARFKCVKWLLSYWDAVFHGFLMKSVIDGTHNWNENIQGDVSTYSSLIINKQRPIWAILDTWIITAGL